MPLKLPSYKTILLSMLYFFTVQSALSVFLRYSQYTPQLFAALSYSKGGKAQPSDVSSSASCNASAENVDLSWHPPSKSDINNLDSVINGNGTYGIIFKPNGSVPNVDNWCNMPHVNPTTYPKINDSSYNLEYVEVIHRHHKRTPYASNTFPVEGYTWDCDDEGLFYGGKPINPSGHGSTSSYWNVYTSPSNPFAPQGFNGTCQFPQITRGGLDDSYQHGVDLEAVYGDMLGFLPSEYNANTVSYRVTNNIITSQVASMLVAGMYPDRTGLDTPLLIQPAGIDSLEPSYSCPSSTALPGSYGPGSSSPAWHEHLTASADLYTRLDALSGVDPNDDGWHRSWDHYFDNLSARLCHAKALPCNIANTTDCVALEEAEKVFRLGEYEYSFIYRDSEHSLPASIGSYGVWIAELAQNLRHAMGATVSSTGDALEKAKYRHNVAHDGSISRLLSILQVDKMVWPGMGAEVVFELYSKEACYFVRVLWGGQVMISSNPSLGSMDLVPVSTVLAYFDGLVGIGASRVPGICQGTS